MTIHTLAAEAALVLSGLHYHKARELCGRDGQTRLLNRPAIRKELDVSDTYSAWVIRIDTTVRLRKTR